MKISFITTVLSEEKTVDRFLESLSLQSKIPDEVVIVDGGSSDRTVAKIKNARPAELGRSGEKLKMQNDNAKFKILIKRGNRSVGRNEAIRKSTGDIIACSDVGCALDRDWLKNITEPFRNKDVDVVAGFYKAKTNSIFEKCLATYTCVMPDKIDRKNFLPSSRSIAFRKTAWEKVGGYPEYLDTCEDLAFARKLKQEGFKFKFIKNAIVYWPQRENLLQAFKQFFNYSKGDGAAHYFRPQTPFLFGRYIIGLALLILFFISFSYFVLNTLYLILTTYFVWSIIKNYRYVGNWQAFFILPTLQITSDLAVLSGTTIGFIKSLNRK